MPADPQILAIPQWVAGAFGVSFLTLMAALGFMLKRTFGELEGIQKKMDEAFDKHIKREDFTREIERVMECIDGVKKRTSRIELKCAAMHGTPEFPRDHETTDEGGGR